MYRSVATQRTAKYRTAEIFRVWNGHGQRGRVTMAIPDAAFSAVRFCSYTVGRTQYDRPSWRQQLRFLFYLPHRLHSLQCTQTHAKIIALDFLRSFARWHMYRFMHRYSALLDREV